MRTTDNSTSPTRELSIKQEVQQKNMARIVNIIAVVTFIFASVFGHLLFQMTDALSILSGATIEALACLYVLYLNGQKKYQSAIFLTFIIHCTSTLYFGLMFTEKVPVDLMIIFLGGMACLIFQQTIYRMIGVAVIIVMIMVLEYNYSVQFAPANTHTLPYEEYIRQMVIGTVIFLTFMMLYFYANLIRLWQNRTIALLNRVEASKQAVVKYVQESSHQSRTDLNVLYGIIQHDFNLSTINPQTVSSNASINIPVQHLEAMYNATRAVIDQSNNYLEWARIEQGLDFPIKNEILNVDRWLQNITGRFRLLAERRGVKLTLSIEPTLPTHIMMDKNRLETIIGNLLTNAIKFTRANTQVDLTVHRGEANLYFTVCDQGPGIDLQKQVAIFQRFTTEENGFIAGTGLGLTVSQELARAMGGDLTVSSELEEGSTFTVSLPLVVAGNNEPPPRSSLLGNLAGLSALIIEDDMLQQLVLQINLRQHHLKVFCSASEEEAQSVLKDHKIDFLLIDYQLSQSVNGLDILRRLKANPKTKNIPVIIASGQVLTGTHTDIRKQALQEGAAGYVTKPLDFEVLTDVIGSVVERKHIK